MEWVKLIDEGIYKGFFVLVGIVCIDIVINLYNFVLILFFFEVEK